MTVEIMGESIIAGLATLLGAIIVLVTGQLSEKSLALLLGMAGGVMISVVIFDLLPSSLVYGNALVTALGFIMGVIFMLFLDIIITLSTSFNNRHNHRQSTLFNQTRFLKMGYLIAVGIALHDLPEGIAIAVGYAAEDSLGFLIALAIGLHNIPEGMATAAPLALAGIPPFRIILTCLGISFFTPLGAFLGIMIIAISHNVISLLLALAGGAMAFIVKSELLPEAYRKYSGYATLGFLLGAFLIPFLEYIQKL
jgi:ZIP family zinc transporter